MHTLDVKPYSRIYERAAILNRLAELFRRAVYVQIAMALLMRPLSSVTTGLTSDFALSFLMATIVGFWPIALLLFLRRYAIFAIALIGVCLLMSGVVVYNIWLVATTDAYEQFNPFADAYSDVSMFSKVGLIASSLLVMSFLAFLIRELWFWLRQPVDRRSEVAEIYRLPKRSFSNWFVTRLPGGRAKLRFVGTLIASAAGAVAIALLSSVIGVLIIFSVLEDR